MTSAGGHCAAGSFTALVLDPVCGAHDSLRAVSLVASSIAQAFELGRGAYPTINLPRAAFTAFAQARAETWGGAAERAADMYLACACVERLPAAVAEFLARFGDRIPAFIGRLARNPDLVAEVR